MFVAEKSGIVKVFDHVADPTPTVFVDLSTNTYNFWDRGMLGLALHPGFPANPYVYVLYTYDHQLGSSTPAPRWGTPGVIGDPCPTPPGPTSDGCVVSARLSRFQASGNVAVGGEQVLVEDWCQQYPSHSIGDLAFGPDGALYATAGDGASFTFVDWGQDGNPVNPCGDPPGDPGDPLTPPTAEGGMLRSQDLRTSGDPVSLDGTVIRVDPATGAALPSNPQFANSDPNARRIIAYGLRNPFRFAFRPSTSELWIGDVGWSDWEEINRIVSPTDSTVENFGWPCYEGTNKQNALDSANLNICENLYAQPSADTTPYHAYRHADKVVPNEPCPTGTSSISGLAFEFSTGASPYPDAYDDALFFSDYSRDCIWVMKKGGGSVPAPGLIETLVSDAANPVVLERGLDGLIYYADFDGGTIHRIDFAGASTPPTNSAPPSVSGQASVGSTLTVSPGTWSGTQPITFAHQWRRCDAAGANCANIAGATASSYVVAAGDLGATLRVRETASNSVGSAFADSAQTAVVTQPSPSAYRDAVLADNPFLYWRLGEPSGTFADSSSGGTNAGTASGTGMTRNVANLVSANSDGALTFTNATTNVATTATIAGLPSATVSTEIWFRAAGFANSIDLVNHAYGSAGSHGWAMWLGSNRKLNFGLWQSGGAQQVVVSSALTANTTYHAVGTYDGNIMRLYVNGTQVATKTVGPRTLNTSAGVFTGRTDTTAGVTVDELALYPGALSASRVQAHFAASSGGGSNQAPTPTIAQPIASTTWNVGQVIAFQGSASDPEDGALPASALTWDLIVHHCPSNCHTHPVQSFPDVASGSFAAPDHEYPSHLELRLTAEDSDGSTGTTSVLLQPRTVAVTLASSPTGLQLSLNAETATAPFTRTLIEGSTNSVSAPNQSSGGTSYTFSSWSDGGAQSHNITAGATTTLTATFTSSTPTPPTNSAPPSVSGQASVGSTLTVSPGTWSGTQPITFAHQWRRCDAAGANCANIAGATASSYVVAAGDLGATLRVRETASNSVGSAFADSAQTAVVTQPSPSAYRDAVLADNPFLYWRLGEPSGTFADSSSGGTNAGTASGTGMTRNVANLVSANSDGALTFTNATTNVATTATIAGLPSATVSTEIWFRAAGFANSIDLVNHAYGSAGSHGWAMWLSAAGALNFGLWQSGGAQQVVVSSALTANTTYHAVGTYDGNIMRLYVNGTQVATKTIGAVTLNTSAGVFTGRTDTTAGVTVDELALYPGALSASRVQAHFAASGNGGASTPPTNSAPPSVSGQASVGSTLTVSPGTWSGTQPITFAHQWRRCDAAGANCANIAGATASSYVVAAGDLGATLRVRETASNSVGSAFADSAQTAVVTQPSPSAYRDAVLADNPFLYWRLGEPSGTFADSSSGGTNAGTASGTGMTRNVANLVSANSDGALTFTNATTNVATTATIAGLPSATVSTEIWFRAAGFANSIDLVNHAYGSAGSHGWAMWLSAAGALNFGLWQSGGAQQVVVSSALTANTTYHAVGTYDGNIMRLYVNGTQVATKTIGAVTLNTSAGVFTGRTDTTAGVTVDELALYPGALSASRVQAHFAASGN